MKQEAPVRTVMYDQLCTEIYRNDQEMGTAVALKAREIIVQAIAERGEANITFSVGKSHDAFLRTLRDLSGIDWSHVNVFVVDMSIGTPPGHLDVTARLKSAIIDAVKPGAFYTISSLPLGSPEVEKVCWEYADLLRKHPSDVTIVGFGFSGHMALNDPPYADFNDPEWVKVAKRNLMSRTQNVVEGSYESPDQVPAYAITLTIPALLAAKNVLCEVAGPNKADIVRTCLTVPICEAVPGSILRRVPHARLYLDLDSAAKL